MDSRRKHVLIAGASMAQVTGRSFAANDRIGRSAARRERST